jgi:hypothetical protein
MEDQHTKESCKGDVMNRIECERICPRSRVFFRTKECLVWVVWAFSVLVGALAVTTIMFVVTHHQYAFYEATHSDFFTFTAEALPYVWIVLFGAMALFATFYLRITKRGYRHPLWKILGSSLVFSVAGGGLLHLLGFGYFIDHELGERMDMYDSQEKRDTTLWQVPHEGRLLGTQIDNTSNLSSSTIAFSDIDKIIWNVDVSELSAEERALLENYSLVRLIGQTSNSQENTFYSCGAFPWFLDKPMPRAEMKVAREAFIEKIEGYKERAKEVSQHTDDQSGAISPCVEIAAVKRR